MNSSPFDLARFLEAQDTIYSTVLKELQAGQKRTHWMWFIFPQVEGLGTSGMAVRYAIQSKAEAKAYLEHPILGVRLRECVEALLSVQNRTAVQILGDVDASKLRSSATLFNEVSHGPSLFSLLLDKYYDGRKDEKTLTFLSRSSLPKEH